MENENTVTITFTKDEALVLFDFISRFNAESREYPFEDQAEQRAMWNFECLFERALVEPFLEDYLKIIADARDRLRDPVE